MISFPFDTRRITTMNVVFGKSGWLPLDSFLVHCPTSVASCWLSHHPFFHASWIPLAHFFRNISTHCRQIHLALLKLSNGNQLSNVSKKSLTSVSQCRGSSLSCFKMLWPRKMDLCFFSKNPATYPYFHLFNALLLDWPSLLANCFKEYSVCFRLTGCVFSAPLNSNEFSLSLSAS